MLQKTRSQSTHLTRQGDHLAELGQRFGWQALVTKAGQQRRSGPEAVVCERTAYRVERIFNRRKSRGHLAPLFVTRHAHIEGLPYRLTRGGRVGTVTEFVLRRSLETAPASLPGLPPENKPKRTDKPPAERSLKALAAIALTIIKTATGADVLRRLTPLSGLQEEILQRLGWGTAL